jgi:hypothetical protein
VEIFSSSTEVGYDEGDSSFNFNIPRRQRKLDPRGRGEIDIYVPDYDPNSTTGPF